jgi:hypothetical protein
MINIYPKQKANKDENERKTSEKGTKTHRIITNRKKGEKGTGFSEPSFKDEDLYHVVKVKQHKQSFSQNLFKVNKN